MKMFKECVQLLKLQRGNKMFSKKGDFAINQVGIIILVLLGLVLALFVLGFFGNKLFDTGLELFSFW